MSNEHESYTPPNESPVGSLSDSSLTSEEKNWAMACHISALAGFIFPFCGSIAGPLIIWLLKRNDSNFIDANGKEAVNFQITMAIAFVVAAMLIFAMGIGLLLIPIVGLVWLILTIMAAIGASDGKQYRYPFALRLIN